MYSKEQQLYQENRNLHELCHKQGQVIADQRKDILSLKVEIQYLKEQLQEEQNIRKVLYQPKEDGKTKRKRNSDD